MLIESGEEVGPAEDVGEPSEGEAGVLTLEQARSKARPLQDPQIRLGRAAGSAASPSPTAGALFSCLAGRRARAEMSR